MLLFGMRKRSKKRYHNLTKSIVKLTHVGQTQIYLKYL